jgi:tetratricopeptide (TPR) repeat protein
LDPKSPWAYLGLGHTRLFQGKYEEAIPYLQKALEMNPRYFRMSLDLAACYAAIGRQEEAKAAAEQVLKASPKFSIDRFINSGLPIESTEIIKPYIDALRKIPFPET